MLCCRTYIKLHRATMRWLEMTLNQIRLQYPGRMTDLEVQQHWLFHWFHKHICDSVWYLYSTPRTSYLQLMAATNKVESENEEIWDKVRVRAMVVTDSGKEQQNWGNRLPSSWPPWQRLGKIIAPLACQVAHRRGITEGDTVVVASPAPQIPIMVGGALDRPPQPMVYLLGREHWKRK